MSYPNIEFALIGTANPEDVARYMWWLYRGRWPDDDGDHTAAPTPEEIRDAFWHWDAPRPRLLKLLWQLLHGTADEVYFHSTFTADMHWFIEDAAECAELLPPIQERLRRVLDAIETVQTFSIEAGQSDWGEELFLPPPEAAIVQEQLERVAVRLLEKESEYEEALRYSVGAYRTKGLAYIPPALMAEDRRYEGTMLPLTQPVAVVSGTTTRPLINADDPTASPGRGMAWGYAGHGPNVLSISILTDALDGDVALAGVHAMAFRDELVSGWPQDRPFMISRADVLKWLDARGVGVEARQAAMQEVQTRREQLEKRGAPLLARWNKVRGAGGLVTQRFDLVPADFEAGLYVDLMRMLQRGGGVMRCAWCELPIGFDGSSRVTRQRARYREGRPVYHEGCNRAHRLDKKRRDWKRRSADPDFRQARREEAKRSRRRA